MTLSGGHLRLVGYDKDSLFFFVFCSLASASIVALIIDAQADLLSFH